MVPMIRLYALSASATIPHHDCASELRWRLLAAQQLVARHQSRARLERVAGVVADAGLGSGRVGDRVPARRDQLRVLAQQRGRRAWSDRIERVAEQSANRGVLPPAVLDQILLSVDIVEKGDGLWSA